MPPLDLERTALVVVGVATNVCVAGMARELADADFDA
jgi:nicotinamidase-related amidase